MNDMIEQQQEEIRRLTAENKHLTAAVERQTQLSKMSIDQGALEIDVIPPREVVINQVLAARAILGDAENYSETPVELPPSVEMGIGTAGERYVVIVQRPGKLTPHQARRQAEAERDAMAERLAAIGERINPCSPPDVYNGFDLCPCGHGGSWPCPTTEAAWIAHGLDPREQPKKILADMRPANEEW